MSEMPITEWLRKCTHGRPTASGAAGTDGDRFEEAAAEIERLRGERNPPSSIGRDQVVGFLRYYASEPYADSSNETVRVRALLLTTAADEIERLQRILVGIAEYCSGDGQPIGAIERLTAIRNTANRAVEQKADEEAAA